MKGPPVTRTRTRTRTCRGVDVDEVVYLLRCGDTIETVARRLGVEEEYIVTVARRKGTPEQRARIAQASEEMRDIRLSLAS